MSDRWTKDAPTASPAARSKESHHMQIHSFSGRGTRAVVAGCGIVSLALLASACGSDSGNSGSGSGGTGEAAGSEPVGVTLITKDSTNPRLRHDAEGRPGGRRQEQRRTDDRLRQAGGRRPGPDRRDRAGHRPRSRAGARSPRSPRAWTSTTPAWPWSPTRRPRASSRSPPKRAQRSAGVTEADVDLDIHGRRLQFGSRHQSRSSGSRTRCTSTPGSARSSSSSSACSSSRR